MFRQKRSMRAIQDYQSHRANPSSGGLQALTYGWVAGEFERECGTLAPAVALDA